MSSGNRADQMVEIIIYMEDRNLEMMLRENEKDLSMKIWRSSTRTIWLHQKEQYKNDRHTSKKKGRMEKKKKSIFKQIVDENFPNLWKELDRSLNPKSKPNTYLPQSKEGFSKAHCIKTVKKEWQRKNSQGSQGRESNL